MRRGEFLSLEPCRFDERSNPETAGIRLTNPTARGSRRTPRIGYLVFDGQVSDLPCALREYDGETATLVLNGWLGMPASFLLYVEPDGMRHSCSIVKRRGNAITVSLAEGSRETRPRSRQR